MAKAAINKSILIDRKMTEKSYLKKVEQVGARMITRELSSLNLCHTYLSRCRERGWYVVQYFVVMKQ